MGSTIWLPLFLQNGYTFRRSRATHLLSTELGPPCGPRLIAEVRWLGDGWDDRWMCACRCLIRRWKNAGAGLLLSWSGIHNSISGWGKLCFGAPLNFPRSEIRVERLGSSLWVMPSAWQLVVRPCWLLSTLDSILSVSGYNILHTPRNVKYFLCEIYLKFSKIAKQPNKLQKHL